MKRWYPFIVLTEDLPAGRKSMLRCGAGYENYSIMTDGHIAPCPVMVGMKRYYIGHIGTTNPMQLDHIHIGGECKQCRILDFCGGRCLYSNITRPWSVAEKKLVCSTVSNLHYSLMDALPRIRRLLSDGKISAVDFTHEKYSGCEVVP